MQRPVHENDPATSKVHGTVLPEELPGEREKWMSSLEQLLRVFFKTGDSSLVSRIEDRIVFLELPAGATLFHEGDASDDVYFVLSGRLRAERGTRNAEKFLLGEIGRGETVGELAMLTGETRSASVIAVRDTILARLGRAAFEQILEEHPALALSVSRIVIQRFRQAETLRQPARKPVTISVFPITPGVDAEAFTAGLANLREKYGAPVRVITKKDLVQKFGGAADAETCGIHCPVSNWLTEAESGAECVFLVAENCPDAWARQCLGQADEVIFLADATQPPVVSALEQKLFDGEDAAPMVVQSLVLLHSPETRSPTGTVRWLDRRPVTRHFHVRRGSDRDLARLARFLSGRAVGVVLAGGGAKAFSHFGVLNALAEFGIHPDYLGGTSMGATAAGWRAMGLEEEAFLQAGRGVYMSKPTNDPNPLPLLSVLRGRKVRHLAERAVLDAAGLLIDVEDTWIPFFCIATDLSHSEQAILKRGPLAKALVASFSIPGALPPVIFQNHLMVDGGTFNNFPVDVMEACGVGAVIGLAMERTPKGSVPLEEMPGSFSLLLDRFRRPENRKYQLPLLPEILLNSTLSASHSKQNQALDRVDLLLQPNTSGVGLLEWDRYDEIVELGYRYAKEILSAMTPAQLDRFR